MKRALSEQKLVEFLSKQEHVKLVYLFGSVARGREGKLSDVDVAVLLDYPLDKRDLTCN
jgi:predicted nucleotidyltransferase